MKAVQTSMAIAIAAFILSACSLTPVEHRPAPDLPGTWLEARTETLTAAEDAGRWQPAEPADRQPPTPWWTLFGDPVLVRLEDEALKANPDVAIAMARLQRARALLGRSEAASAPTLDAGFGPTRQRSSGEGGTPARSQTLWRAQASVAYEVDVFGRVASGVDAARADADAQRALSHQMLLLVQVDVAKAYFSLRQFEGERRLLQETVALRADGVALLEKKMAAGAVARHVVDQARTELSAARAERLAIEQQQALGVHALATLLGRAPAAFALEASALDPVTLQLPAGLPSQLLERRPDIAAAERAMAAENARIGVARSAFFPSLSLTGSLGYESAELGSLANWSQRTFLLGPLVGTALNLPILDGGRRQADVDRARAVYEERVAAYRKTVLQAFREVEDSLVSVRLLDERLVHQREAEASSIRVAQSSRARFDEGDADYLLVVDAERTRLRNRQSRLQSEGQRALATVDLVRALGGGWSDATGPQARSH